MSGFTSKRSAEEIEEQINKTVDFDREKLWGMHYIDGVRAALDWILGDTDEEPANDE